MTKRKMVEKATKKKNKPGKLRDVLDKKFTKKEKGFLTTSFDIVGEIAVIEIREEIRHKEKIIGEAILKMHKNIRTVCRRDSEHEGCFRTQKLKVIAGRRTKETVHKESECNLKLNVEKCYFSVRSGTERLRIVKQINERYENEKNRKKEKILVMFSGVGPYVCVIGKNSLYDKIMGIELNPTAHKYAEENLVLNKIKNAEVVEGDVRHVIPKLKEKYDRILMPLPRTAEEFLDTALLAAKKGTIIHLYGFLAEEEFEEYKDKIKIICKAEGYKASILNLVKCGQFSPRLFRICVDFEII